MVNRRMFLGGCGVVAAAAGLGRWAGAATGERLVERIDGAGGRDAVSGEAARGGWGVEVGDLWAVQGWAVADVVDCGDAGGIAGRVRWPWVA